MNGSILYTRQRCDTTGFSVFNPILDGVLNVKIRNSIASLVMPFDLSDLFAGHRVLYGGKSAHLF